MNTITCVENDCGWKKSPFTKRTSFEAFFNSSYQRLSLWPHSSAVLQPLLERRSSGRTILWYAVLAAGGAIHVSRFPGQNGAGR